jgi:hypothetical protein
MIVWGVISASTAAVKVSKWFLRGGPGMRQAGGNKN